jgi:hypothetical protein
MQPLRRAAQRIVAPDEGAQRSLRQKFGVCAFVGDIWRWKDYDRLQRASKWDAIVKR